MLSTQVKILLVVPRLNIGGAETYVLTTALGLKRAGYQVVVASWGGQLVASLTKAGIPHYLVPIRLSAYLASLFLERIIIKEGVGLVHANSAAAAAAALKVCQRRKLPLVYTAHGVFGYNDQERELAAAERIVCVSECLRQLSIEKGIRADYLRTIYNGIALERFQPDVATAASVRNRLGIAQDEFVIGIVSRIKNLDEKGHRDILEMLAAYPATRKWRFLVVGKGKGLAALKDTARKLGVEQQLCLAGHHTDVSGMLQAMDVMLLPSRFETFGLVLVEAMAMEKPVVAYQVGGIPEAIEDGRTGFVVPARDIDALYQKTQLLATEPDLRQRMGQAGRVRVQQYFTVDAMLAQLLPLYQEALEECAAGQMKE